MCSLHQSSKLFRFSGIGTSVDFPAVAAIRSSSLRILSRASLAWAIASFAFPFVVADRKLTHLQRLC